jgi:two-component system, response regulator
MEEKIILLVEDNPDDVVLTRMALEKSRIINKLVVAEDGEEALDYLFSHGKYAGRDSGQLPEVVLLDLKLPRVDGLEVLKQVRANPATSLLPVVILTSSSEDQDMIKSYKLGCNSFIVKPVDFSQFLDAVQQLEMYWLVLNRKPNISTQGKPRDKPI